MKSHSTHDVIATDRLITDAEHTVLICFSHYAGHVICALLVLYLLSTKMYTDFQTIAPSNWELFEVKIQHAIFKIWYVM